MSTHNPAILDLSDGTVTLDERRYGTQVGHGGVYLTPVRGGGGPSVRRFKTPATLASESGIAQADLLVWAYGIGLTVIDLDGTTMIEVDPTSGNMCLSDLRLSH